jgi:furin
MIYCSGITVLAMVSPCRLIPICRLFAVIVSMLLCSLPYIVSGDEFTNDFAVEIDGDLTVADLVAQSHNLRVVRQVAHLGNVYHLVHDNVARRSRRSADDIIQRLSQDPNVRRVEQQHLLVRDKRPIIHDKQIELPIRHFDDKSIYQRYHVAEGSGGISTKDVIPGSDEQTLRDVGFNDPFFKDQWYLVNRGQTGGTVGYDINVLPVWRKGFTGRGVVVSILDDGIDHTHPDLSQNYDVKASADLNDRSDVHNDPMPNGIDPSNSHGTRCAGEVAAAANNSNCCVGVAYNAKIGGIRMLDGAVTDLLEAEAVTYNNQYIDIYSASWGPTDDGKTMEGPHHYCQQALREGVTKGRGGKGSIFVWATGNGGSVGDDCSCDGYVSSIYTLSVGCISDQGLSTYFSEVCPSTFAVVFTGGSHYVPGNAEYTAPKIKVVTTDLNGDCTLEFQGTSSAAPLAAGCIALVLEANGNLTWRDIQNIVVETSRIPNGIEDGWTVNGGGHHVNHHFGFGAMDCGRMVEAAQSWISVQEQHVCNIPHSGVPIDIYPKKPINSTLEVTRCNAHTNSMIDHLEHVQVHVRLEHERRGDIKLVLVSPAGTRSSLLSRRPFDDSADGIDFTFMTVHHWGENPDGRWTLEIGDEPRNLSAVSFGQRRGRLLSWSLTLYGVAGERPNHRSSNVSMASRRPPKSRPMTSSNAVGRDQAHQVGTAEVKELMAEEVASKESVRIESAEEWLERNRKLRERQRKVLLENGLDPADVEFLLRLFEVEQQSKDGTGQQRPVKLDSNAPLDQSGDPVTSNVRSSRFNYDPYRRAYASQADPRWLKDKRNMADMEAVGMAGNGKMGSERGSASDLDTLEEILRELSDILDNH